MRLLPRFDRLLRGTWPRRASWFVLTVGSLVLVEILGRSSQNDFTDALLLMGLVTIFAVSWAFLERDRSPFTVLKNLLRRPAARVMRTFAVEIGVDLRRTPPLPRGIPQVVGLLGMTLAALLVPAVLMLNALPMGLRAALVPVAFTPYLFLLALLWSTLLVGTFLMVLLAYALIHDALLRMGSSRTQRSLAPEMAVVLGSLAILTLFSVLLPRWVPLVGSVALGLANAITLALPGNPTLALVWRKKAAPSAIRKTFDGRLWLLAEIFTITLAFALASALTQGRLLLQSDAAHPLLTMPVTSTLGLLCLWIAFGGWAALSGWYAFFAYNARQRNPGAACPIPLVVRGVQHAETKSLLLGTLEAVGFRPSFRNEPAEKGAIDVAVFDPGRGQDPTPPLTWPPLLTPRALGSQRELDALTQRHQVHCRRVLTKTLVKLLKQNTQREFQSGSGFWIAPHLWFFLGLQRDTSEEEPDLRDGALLDESISPPWYRLLPLSARHHFFVVMNALELDLIFLEDGVNGRKFRRVLQTLFTLFDDAEGPMRAEDLHFVGMAGLRVIIHEIGERAEFQLTEYPEPDYDGLGRARILHVYRDRGGNKESPVDQSRDRVPAFF